MHPRLSHWFTPRQPALWVLALLFFLPALASSQTPECGWHPSAFATGSVQIPVPAALVFAGSPPPGVESFEVEDALARAIATWNEVQCAPALKMAESGSTESASPVLFVDEDPCLPAKKLAFTVYACRDYPYGTILLNSRDFVWRTTPSPLQPFDDEGRLIVDMLAVLTHEVGHVLGLGHLDDPLSTMALRYLGDGGQATLAAVDKLTLCSTHDSPLSECTSNLECPFLLCVEDGENAACEEERGQIGDFCGPDLMICDPCLITSTSTLTGYCTVSCETCPEGMECGDSGLCEFSQQAREGGCGTGDGSISWMLLLLILGYLRRTRGNARRPWSSYRADAHRRRRR